MNILLTFAEFGLSEEDRDRQCLNTRPFFWKLSVDYPNCYLGGRVPKKEKEQLKFQALKGHAAGEADSYMVTVNTKERIHHHLCLLRNPPPEWHKSHFWLGLGSDRLPGKVQAFSLRFRAERQSLSMCVPGGRGQSEQATKQLF